MRIEVQEQLTGPAFESQVLGTQHWGFIQITQQKERKAAECSGALERHLASLGLLPYL